jgi:energy-coupling factor transport system substrate-specific component
MVQENALNSRDLITVGLFTAIIVVITMIVMVIGFIPVLLPLYCVFITLPSGIPFMLFLSRVRKFGMIMLMSILLALFLLLTGMGWYTFPLVLITGGLSELIVRAGHYRSLTLDIAAYAVFSIWCFGSYIPLIFMADRFWEENAVYGSEYIETAKGLFQLWMAPTLIFMCVFFGWVGGMIGGRMLKKHFIRAGIV